MAYVTTNPKTKTELKKRIEAGRKIVVFSPGIGPDYSNHTGVVTVEGPHAPEPHKWYGQVTLEDGVITKVK